MRYWFWAIFFMVLLIGCNDVDVEHSSRAITFSATSTPILKPSAPPTHTPIEPKGTEQANLPVAPSPVSQEPEATPRPTETPRPQQTSNDAQANGLIMRDARHDGRWTVVREGKAQRLTEYERARLLGFDGYSSAVFGETVYVVDKGDILRLTSATETTPIATERIEHQIFGIVEGWLMVSSFNRGEIYGQEIGSLTAVSLDGSAYEVIREERPFQLPVVAPDQSRIIFNENDVAKAWYPNGTVDPLPFGRFRNGGISPNSQYIALDRGRQLDVYELSTNQLLASSQHEVMGGDGFSFPAWHPNSTQVAFEIAIPEQNPPFAVRILSLDGTVLDITTASYPAFSPDGEWLAIYQNIRNQPETVLVHLPTQQRYTTSFAGLPIAWVEYSLIYGRSNKSTIVP